MEPRHINADQIMHLVSALPDLHQDQRTAIRDLLTRLEQAGGGKIPQRDLHEALLRLRQSNAITELDMKHIESAVFGG